MPDESIPRPSRVNPRAGSVGVFYAIQEFKCGVCGNPAEVVQEGKLVRVNEFTPPADEIELFLVCNNPNCSQRGVKYHYPYTLVPRYPTYSPIETR